MQIKPERRSHQDRTDATRAALVSAARRLFIEKGYAKTATPEIVAAAQLTRGALYHHFADKADVFWAVAQQCAHEVAERVDAGSRTAGSPLDALLNGADSYFAAMAEHGRASLLLLEAPAILSAAQRLHLSELAGEHELQQGLAEALPASLAASVPLTALTSLVSAAFDHAALAIALGAPPSSYQVAIRLLLSQLIRPTD